MKPNAGDALSSLLPQPRKFSRIPGFFAALSDLSVSQGVERRVESAVKRWLDKLPRTATSDTPCSVQIAVEPSAIVRPDGYRLTVQSNRVELVGQSQAACFWGIQTLQQLTDLDSGQIPCCGIEDWSDYATRGLLHDVSRGKVPTFDTLKRLADRLASWKINQLQLYIEHAFTFSFDPEICGPDEGLTPDEIRELDRYCRDRFIDLVPAVATLGHMGRILSLSKYRHLAEIEPDKSWSELNWAERARGFTLDIANPESRDLVQKIWTEILAAFSSPIVNICGDEPWDLGKGKNKERFANGRGEQAYVDQICWTHGLCAAHGRRVQVWSDVVKNHPDLLHQLPRDLTILHWGYDDRADYQASGKFVESGLPTVCCPGTSGWKRMLNAMNLAERNIQTFARVGKEHGVVGILNTDWGDHGHFNALACSWHGIALGGALGWNVEHPTGAEFDRILARHLFSAEDETIIADLRESARVADKVETWRLMWMPVRQVADDPSLPSTDLAVRSAAAAGDALGGLEELDAEGIMPDDIAELSLACRAMEFFAEKVAAAQEIRREAGALSMPGRSRGMRRRPEEIAESVDDFAHDYAAAWKRRNKLSGLWDILTALASVASEFRFSFSRRQ